jgi:hypothetical protein
MSEFWEGFKRGARETPAGFFAPVVAIVRWLYKATTDAIEHSHKGKAA